jgi:hypothetical protein
MSLYLSCIKNHLHQGDFRYHLLQSKLKEKQNLKSQKPKYDVINRKILDSRINYRKLEYLVQWQRHGISEKTREPIANLTNALEMIQKFHCQYPE